MMQNNWDREKIEGLYAHPFLDLLLRAQSLHQQHFNHYEIELCSLLSIKTGACPEDCAYCPQSAHYHTTVMREKLLPLEKVVAQALQAKANGATRFCMGAAWRHPPKAALPAVIDMIAAVNAMGLETCATLGMLDAQQAQALKAGGLDFYNHNLDTSPRFYTHIISTHTYQDRLNTLMHAQEAGLRVCCGGILGMGESRQDRIDFLLQLTHLREPPESIPINRLLPIPGTPLENAQPIDNFEFIRTIAITRLLLPNAVIRLSAGRGGMSDEMQALCFLAGANSMWLGNKLLTTPNSDQDKDFILLAKLGMKPKRLGREA